jgi:GNAT superfamily N-acetyltransferase
MKIHLIDPDDPPAVARVHELFELVRAAETPEHPPVSEERYSGALRNPPPKSEFRCYTAVEDDTLLGLMWIYLPLDENAHYAEVELVVHREHRRRGVGSALLDRLLELARAERRSEIVVLARVAVEGGPGRSDGGVRFLERHGFTAALTEVHRSLSIADLDLAVEERLWQEASAAARDCELVPWIGRCPDRFLEGLGRIDSMIFAEIPLGDVDLRPRTVDAEYIRIREDGAEARGEAMVRVIAVHRESGEVAANTLIYVPHGEAHAGQAITIVDPAHRGHRLGLLVKLANLRQLREHFGEVTHVWTGNADVNANMNAINEMLGFRPVDALVSYRREIQV